LNLTALIKSRLIKTIAGVTVHYTKADEYNISFAVLKAIKGKSQLLDSQTGLSSIEDLVVRIGKGIPIWLSVTGRPVITRKLDNDPGGRYLNHVLPNAREADFLVTCLRTVEEQVFVSAVRNDLIDGLIKSFHEYGLNILGYSIGPAPVALLPELDLIEAKTLDIPGYRLISDRKTLTDIESVEKIPDVNYNVGNEPVRSDCLLPFATSLSYLLNQKSADIPVSGNYTADEESFVYKTLNRYLLFASLGLIFFLLLINFIAFSLYNGKQQALSDEISYEKNLFVLRDSLRKEITLKTGLISQMGLSEATRYGFYADRIAGSLPDGISLTSLTLNPAVDKIKAGKPVQLGKYIRIMGDSKGSLPINEWIDTLNKLEWIRDIEIINYEKTDTKGEFEIKIVY
jgi:hypothetical protein